MSFNLNIALFINPLPSVKYDTNQNKLLKAVSSDFKLRGSLSRERKLSPHLDILGDIPKQEYKESLLKFEF